MAAAEQESHARAVRPCSYEDESYRQGFFDTIGDLQKAGVLQDVVLEVEGRRCPCHRLVLSAASPYFRAMFTSDMAESRQKTVVLQGLDAGVFGEILSYIYSGTLHVSLDKVQPLYQAADLLQLDYVRDTCSNYMVFNVDNSTCVDLYRFAEFFSIEVVKNCGLLCICVIFSEVSHTEEFYSLSVNQLIEIISKVNLNVKQETTVWEAVVRWVQHSREDRLHHLPSILPHIRFNLLTSDDTAAILEHPLVKKNTGNSELRNLVQRSGSSNQKRRDGMNTEEVIVLFRPEDGFRLSSDTEMLCVNPSSGDYEKYIYRMETKPTVIAATVNNDNDIYILVHESPDKLSLLQYNHLGNVWENKSSIQRDTPRPSVLDAPSECLVAVSGHLYYLAYEWEMGKGVLVVMKKYQWLTDRWQDCSKPEHDCLCFDAAVSSGKHLYLITNTEMHCYDPSQDSWCKRTPPRIINPDPCTAVAIGTEIFCTDKILRMIAVYNIEADSWSELPGWSDPEESVSTDSPFLFAYEGKLHALVSLDGPGRGDQHMFVYDRSAGAWRDLYITLPDGEWHLFLPAIPVARMYMYKLGQIYNTGD
ncbi:kelch repeat and BTB domain-containing protein 2-like [Branchiostoma floridae x Branchiostoma japonicum]